MKKLILSMSRNGLVAFLTLITIILANLLNYSLSWFSSVEHTWLDYLRPTLISLLLVPILSWHLITMSFRLAVMKTKLKKIITYDSLTNLLSRRAFLEQLDILYKDALHDKSRLSILALDLDHFKSVNDQFGHSAGDYVLYKFGEIVNNLNMGEHICGRLGGEEFAFALKKMEPTEAIEFAENLRGQLINTILIYQSNEIQVTASIGISSLDLSKRQSLDDLLIEADKALYKAKKTGRNKTINYELEVGTNTILQNGS